MEGEAFSVDRARRAGSRNSDRVAGLPTISRRECERLVGRRHSAQLSPDCPRPLPAESSAGRTLPHFCHGSRPSSRGHRAKTPGTEEASLVAGEAVLAGQQLVSAGSFRTVSSGAAQAELQRALPIAARGRTPGCNYPSGKKNVWPLARTLLRLVRRCARFAATALR